MWNFPVTIVLVYCRNTYNLFERFIAKKVCTACSRTNNKIVPLTNLNKYLYNGKGEMKVNINNNSEKFKKNATTHTHTYMFVCIYIYTYIHI